MINTYSAKRVPMIAIIATLMVIAVFAAVLSTSESSITPRVVVSLWMDTTTTTSARRLFLAISQPARHASHRLTVFLAISNFTYLQTTLVSAALPIATTAQLPQTANNAYLSTPSKTVVACPTVAT